jgi:putative chitinase
MSNASVTAEILHATLPQCTDPQKWADALNPALLKYGIVTVARVSSFLAQTGYESSQYNRLSENLNYSTAKRLMQVWPRRFPTEDSGLPYVKNSEGLANFVYAGRLGNGNIASGDGFRYRGRGIIQVTGRANYAAAAKELQLDLVGNPDLLLQPANAALSAAWFWSSRGLNELADDTTGDNDLEDFTEITRRINGGTVGLKDRLALYYAVESRFV